MRVTSFVIGMGAGAAIAMLFAPRSGPETRQMISDKAKEARRIAEERARDFRDMATDKASQLRDRANDVVDRGREAVDLGKEAINRQKSAIAAAVEAGKQTYNQEAQKIS
ncbi:MAG TPA: YtxH domain-containing protein [Candidatus Aquilonibacter sp.]|nr:YtxH domain-containing protein [Candidatus Aquilonibacter sp.]